MAQSNRGMAVRALVAEFDAEIESLRNDVKSKEGELREANARVDELLAQNKQLNESCINLFAQCNDQTRSRAAPGNTSSPQDLAEAREKQQQAERELNQVSLKLQTTKAELDMLSKLRADDDSKWSEVVQQMLQVELDNSTLFSLKLRKIALELQKAPPSSGEAQRALPMDDVPVSVTVYHPDITSEEAIARNMLVQCEAELRETFRTFSLVLPPPRRPLEGSMQELLTLEMCEQIINQLEPRERNLLAESERAVREMFLFLMERNFTVVLTLEHETQQQAAIAKLKGDVREKDVQLDDLTNLVSQLKSVLVQLQEKDTENQALMKKMRESSNIDRLRELEQNEIAALKQASALRESEEALKKEVAALRASDEQSKQIIVDLKHSVEQMKALSDGAASSQGALQTELSDLKLSASTNQAKLAEAERELELLRQSNTKKEAEMREMRWKSEAELRTRQLSQDNEGTLQSELVSVKLELSLAKGKIAESERDIEALSLSIGKKDVEIQALKAQLEHDSKAKKDEIDHVIEKAAAATLGVETEKAQLQHTIKEKESIISGLEAELEAAKQKVEAMKEHEKQQQPRPVMPLSKGWSKLAQNLKETDWTELKQTIREDDKPESNVLETLEQVEASQRANKYRMVVLGPTAAGKTSLVKCFMSNPLFKSLPDGAPTALSEVTVHRCTSEDNENVEFTIYDTCELSLAHPYFFSRHAVYVWVWDMTTAPPGLGSRVGANECSQKEKRFLSNIQAKFPGAMLLIVGTHRDQLKSQDAKSVIDLCQAILVRFEEFINSTVPQQHAERRIKLIGTCAVSCKARTVIGIKDPLQRVIDIPRWIATLCNLEWKSDTFTTTAQQDSRYLQVAAHLRKTQVEKPLLRRSEYLGLLKERQVSSPADVQLCTRVLASWLVIQPLPTNTDGLESDPVAVIANPLALHHVLTQLIITASTIRINRKRTQDAKQTGKPFKPVPTLLDGADDAVRAGYATHGIIPTPFALQLLQKIGQTVPAVLSGEPAVWLRALELLDCVFESAPQDCTQASVRTRSRGTHFVPSLCLSPAPERLSLALSAYFAYGMQVVYEPLPVPPRELFTTLQCSLNEFAHPLHRVNGEDQLLSAWSNAFWMADATYANRAYIYIKNNSFEVHFSPEIATGTLRPFVEAVHAKMWSVLLDRYQGILLTQRIPCPNVQCGQFVTFSTQGRNRAGDLRCTACGHSSPDPWKEVHQLRSQRGSIQLAQEFLSVLQAACAPNAVEQILRALGFASPATLELPPAQIWSWLDVAVGSLLERAVDPVLA